MGKKHNDESVLEVLKLVSPGTQLRQGLDNILKARTGALIVVGNELVMDIIDGGFIIDCEYSPSYLYELAKMDGAIVLNEDMQRFLYANTLLIPNSSIPTRETGTRHRTAERVAIQTEQIVISISQRRNIITIYKGEWKYILRETSIIVNRANQALQTLEKYRNVLDSAVNNLNTLEYEDMVTVFDVAVVIQRTEMLMRVVEEINRYIVELGNEGRLISMQLEELCSNVEEDELLIIEDYILEDLNKNSKEIIEELREKNYDKILDLLEISKTIGYSTKNSNLDMYIKPRGYRMLNKVPRIPMSIISKIVNEFGNFPDIMSASIERLDEVEGVGEVRARTIREGIKRIREQVIWDNLRKNQS